MRAFVLVTNIPTPYRVPLFNVLSKLLEEQGVELYVIFAARTYARRAWIVDDNDMKFKYEYLNSKEVPIQGGESAAFSYSGLFRRLRHLKPEWIVFGGYGICAIKCIAYSLFFNSLSYIWSGEIINPNRKVGFLRGLYRRFIALLVHGGVAYGDKAIEYLCSIGMDKKNITKAINTVDLGFFYGTENKTINKNLLCVGNLEPLKRVDLLIDLMSMLKEHNFQLHLIGSGSQLHELNEMVSAKGLSECIHFYGFLQKNEILDFYHKSDFLLFPSEYDIWGLVVLESMSAGTPVIASKYPGVVPELIVDDITGFVVDFENTEALANKIISFYGNENLNNMSKNCRDYVENKASLKVSAQGFVDLLR